MKTDISHDAGALRREAEAVVQLRAASSPPPSEEELRALYRELEIHEIELERLNQMLQVAKGEAEAAAGHFADLFEFSPVGYFNLTSDGMIRLVNFTGAKLMGIERVGLVGRHFQVFIAEADRAAFHAFLQRVFTIPSRHVCELRLLGKGAAFHFVHLEALLAPDGQRCRMGMLDITERMLAEKELKEGVQRLRLAAQATGVGIWEWNVITNQIRWDEQMFRIYGLTPTANGLVPYTAWSGAVMPEELPQQEAALQDMVRRCGQSRREFRIRRADDGEIRELEAVETVRTNGGGKAEWVVGTNLDVTERKRAEAVVREREVFIHDVIDSLSAHTAVLDEHGVILSVNEAWKRFAAENSGDENKVGPGINYLEVCRRSLDSSAGKFSQEAGQGIQSVINGTISSFRLEYSCHSPTVKRWFLMNVLPLRGARKGVVVTHENITETKQAEQELTGKNLELAKALAKVRQLSGLLPICAGCKKIRDDYGVWKPVEIYVGEHSEANFTHGFCPDCSRKYFPPTET